MYYKIGPNLIKLFMYLIQLTYNDPSLSEIPYFNCWENAACETIFPALNEFLAHPG